MSDPRYEKVKDVAPPVEVRDIPGVEFYGAAADGRIWAYRRGRFLKPQIKKAGYLTVEIARNGKSVCKTVHRLVAAAWLPNPDNLPCVNHLNGDKTDPRVANLEWCTHRQNDMHALATGLRERRLTPEAIAEIISTKKWTRGLLDKHGISKSLACAIRRGAIYRETG